MKYWMSMLVFWICLVAIIILIADRVFTLGIRNVYRDLNQIDRELHIHENHIRGLLWLHGGRYGEDRMELKK